MGVKLSAVVLCCAALIFSGCGKHGHESIHAAALAGDLAEVQRFHKEQSIGLESMTEDGSTVLHQAARGGSIEVIVWLCEAGADKEAHNIVGFTPLQVAILEDQVGAVRQLLKSGADVNGPAATGVLPLALATGFGNEEIIDLLKEHRARLN